MTEKQSQVMDMIEMVSKQHHPNASKEQAVAALMESSYGDYRRDRFYKARPDAPEYEIVQKAAPVAGGDKARILAEELDRLVTEQANSSGISKFEAYEVVKTTERGWALIEAHQEAGRCW